MDEVEIEGLGSVSRVIVPPIRVPLPLVVWPARGKTIVLGLILGVLCPPITALCLSVLLGPIHEIHAPIATKTIMMAYLLGGTLGGLALSGAAFTCIVDGLRRGPALKISSDGLEDSRAGVFVPWTSIREGIFLPKNGGVDLLLRLPMQHRQHIFRIGVFGYQYRRDPSRLVVATTLLDKPSWLVVSVILKMARLHGATIPTYRTNWFSRQFETDAHKRR